jgi:divalent metal cation (Fe/Co/Zn/Cd) transporter
VSAIIVLEKLENNVRRASLILGPYGLTRELYNLVMSSIPLIDRHAVARRGRHLELFTIGWNSIEGLIAIGAGAVAGSISLVGFGIDSLIEVTSGAALLWRMNHDADYQSRERVERLSLRIVGVCFLALALYIAIEAVKTLWEQETPEHSLVGIVLACVSLAVMPLLSRAKRQVASQLESAAMHADAKQTEFCTYLSAILLAGLLLNNFLGWWWADPVAALVMSPIIANEGREALSGKHCSDC